jgi:hypothetical protein
MDGSAPEKAGGPPKDAMIGSLINISGLVSGGATLFLYFKANSYVGAFTSSEQAINLSASVLALAFGTVGVLDFVQKPSGPQGPPLPPPPSNSTEPAPVLMNSMYTLPLEYSPIL